MTLAWTETRAFRGIRWPGEAAEKPIPGASAGNRLAVPPGAAWFNYQTVMFDARMAAYQAA